jgi:hypothetical protein
MKTLRNLFLSPVRKNRSVVEQLELPLAGARLTRDEANLLAELRRLREELARA